MEDNYRVVIAGFLSGLLGYLNPIAGDVFSLFWIFFLNFMFGLVSGKICGHEDFDLKKAWRCIWEASLFFLIVASIYGIGRLKGNLDGAVQCVSSVVYVVIYFYTTNVLKNIRKILRQDTPAYKVVDALYYILSFEIVKRLPVLSNYMAQAEHPGTETQGTVA